MWLQGNNHRKFKGYSQLDRCYRAEALSKLEHKPRGHSVRIPVIFRAIAICAMVVGASQSLAQERGPVFIPPSPSFVPGGAPWMEAWAGIGATKSYFGGFVGGNVSLSPHRNVWAEGFVLRGEAAVGESDATSPVTDDFLVHSAALMLGYRARVGNGLLSGYVGVAYETQDNDDITARVRGTEVGFKALVEYYTRFTPVIDFYGMASYASPFETAFLFGRVGFNVVGKTWVGPELSFYRNEGDYKENRLGAFIRFDELWQGAGLTFSGGWLHPQGTTTDSWYASASVYFPFR